MTMTTTTPTLTLATTTTPAAALALTLTMTIPMYPTSGQSEQSKLGEALVLALAVPRPWSRWSLAWQVGSRSEHSARERPMAVFVPRPPRPRMRASVPPVRVRATPIMTERSRGGTKKEVVLAMMMTMLVLVLMLVRV